MTPETLIANYDHKRPWPPPITRDLDLKLWPQRPWPQPM